LVEGDLSLLIQAFGLEGVLMSFLDLFNFFQSFLKFRESGLIKAFAFGRDLLFLFLFLIG